MSITDLSLRVRKKKHLKLIPGFKVPSPHKIRTWVDKSGNFKVDAEFLGVSDGKAHLHKTNGVRIAVPLEKLDTSNIKYIKSLPGNEDIVVPSAPTAKPAPARAPSMQTLAAAASAPGVPVQGNFIYNGFNWREWLLNAGVASGDAAIYAEKFVTEKMDSTNVPDLDRDVLRALGVSEGDILRIKKHAALPAVSADKNRQRELQAQQQNLARLGMGGAFPGGGVSLSFPFGCHRRRKLKVPLSFLSLKLVRLRSGRMRNSPGGCKTKNSILDAVPVGAVRRGHA